MHSTSDCALSFTNIESEETFRCHWHSCDEAEQNRNQNESLSINLIVLFVQEWGVDMLNINSKMKHISISF